METKEVLDLLKGVADENKAAVKQEINDAVSGLVKADELEEKINSISDANNVSFKEVKDAIEAQGVAIESLKIKEADKVKNIEDLINDVSEDLAKVVSNRTGKTSFEIKTDVTRASVTNHTLAMRLSEIGQLAYKATKLEPIFNSAVVSPNSNGVIRYVDQQSLTRNAAFTAEAAQKPESAIVWQEYTETVQKIADTLPITMEAAADVNFIASEIRNFLLNNLNLKIDTDLYSGDGNSPNISGIYTKADTFTAAASGIGGANLFDLILKVQEDIVDGAQYVPNVALVGYDKYNSMLLNKEATTNAYIAPNWSAPVVMGGQPVMNVNGITVLPSASVTANTMVVGDFNFATIYNLGGISVDMGWIDKQFIENMMTLRAERRLAMLVRNAHTDAFRKVADVDAALTTLAS